MSTGSYARTRTEPRDFAWYRTPAAHLETRRYSGAVRVPDSEIVCVDCGGPCYPLGWQPADGEVADGTVIPYRCRDCHDRWDVVMSSDDEL